MALINGLKQFINYIGPLRGMLAIIVILLIAVAPFAGGEEYRSAWGVFRGAVAPALMVIIAFVLPLDIMMSLVFMVDLEGAERDRYRTIIRIETLLLVGLLLAWTPVIVSRLGYLK